MFDGLECNLLPRYGGFRPVPDLDVPKAIHEALHTPELLVIPHIIQRMNALRDPAEVDMREDIVLPDIACRHVEQLRWQTVEQRWGVHVAHVASETMIAVRYAV